eukprot:9329585-Alexandrium_andersonii.AAC.1
MLPREGTGCFSCTCIRYRYKRLQARRSELYSSELDDHYMLAQAFEWGKRRLFASLTVHARAIAIARGLSAHCLIRFYGLSVSGHLGHG